MANVPKAITDLPVASAMGDDDLLVVSQNATTSSIKGELIKSYAQNAVASQVTAAQTAATQAANSATNAESARQGAEDAQEAAESAQTSAEQAATEATNAAGTIGDSVEQAQGYATQAGSARDAAISAQQAAETAEDNAVSAKTAAETAQTAAEGSATQAAGSATTAQSAATQAGEAKDDAVTAQGQAETAANTATSAANSAQDSATDAENAKTYIENMNMEGNTLPAGSQVTVTKTQDSQGNLLFVIGVPQGPQGEQGVQGEQGIQGPQGVSVTNATVNEDGDLVITLSSGSPINAGSVIGPQGIQGEVGPTGASVDRIERTSGTGAPGTTDTYTVYLTDGKTGGTFQVYNGSNGTGSGDFMADGSVPMAGDLQMGGHKITDLAEPTDNTDAASKEYVDDTITVSLVGNYIPVGQKGQANGVASLDNSGKVPNEQLPPMDYVPTSRTVNGHALSADVTLDADDVRAIPNPTGGTTGQVLTKTSTGEEWSDAPSGLPEGGTEGQILKRGASGAEWDDAEWLPLSGGTMSGDINMADPTSDYDPSITANGIKNSTSPWIQWNVGDPGKHNLRIGTDDGYIKFTPESDGRSCFVDLNSGYNISVNTGLDVSDNLWVGGSNGIGFGEQPYSDKLYLYRNNEALSLKGNGGTAIRLENVASPTNTNDAVPLGYLNTQLSTKLTTPNGTQGQLLGFTADNTVGAVDAPEIGLTQEQADERYLQLTGGTANQDFSFSYGTQDEYGAKITLTQKDGIVTSKLATNNDLYQVSVSEKGVEIGSETPEINVYEPGFVNLTGQVSFVGLGNEGLYLIIDPNRYGLPSITFNGALGTIKNLASPDNDSDAANKAYVDSKSPTSVTVTLTTSGWSSNTQTVAVSGVSASETAQLITPTPAIASQSAYYEAGIMCTGQAANSLTFTCQTIPTSNLTVYIVIQPLS